MQLEQELKEKTADIEKLLERMLPEEAGLQKTIFSAMRYSLMAGGKRIRPLLIAETYRFFGGTDMALAEPFMAAIEMIHTYSLIHDDLLCLLDNIVHFFLFRIRQIFNIKRFLLFHLFFRKKIPSK